MHPASERVGQRRASPSACRKSRGHTGNGRTLMKRQMPQRALRRRSLGWPCPSTSGTSGSDEVHAAGRKRFVLASCDGGLGNTYM
eukprot:scaffold1190_cov393-Prasinococcus_capsulatus_cf.AAC.20